VARGARRGSVEEEDFLGIGIPLQRAIVLSNVGRRIRLPAASFD